MGRVTRWIKGLFGIKTKEKDRLEHNSPTTPLKLTPVEAALLRSFYSESTKDRNRHAIAMAAATAAAANAAVAAAQAAANVVRLTVHDRGIRIKLAATKIQKVFRGFLARKALRALKRLVKIQALVRGYLVRKQVAATLRGMETLIRVQASVRARANKSKRLNQKDHTFASKLLAQKSLEKFDKSPKMVEVEYGLRTKSRSRRTSSWVSTPSSESFRRDFFHIYPARVSIPETQNFQDQECHLMTTQSTPRLAYSCSCNSLAKSVCVESFNNIYDNNPNYMAKTKSFRAKLRSFSTPRQRPGPNLNRRMLVHEMMESRNSMRMQRSCSRGDEAVSFKNVVMGKFGRSVEVIRES